MDSMIAHAHVLSLFAAEAAAIPDQWRHDRRDGSLTYRFDGSTNTFKWDVWEEAKLVVIISDRGFAIEC